ncbi:sigma-70 family RNA polymerase sigma factor [Flavobacterium sufflavum]|uniref:Sigma-70 family RNA polymerase sigma factor n=1 Tax=Flavobacterium sufflavum TaxID=1921138 RepID=A0A3S2UN73_9FLAO|nr:sigma-70 family RNA polymerase sigma factor [Flavobacterium sufflavum]RVT75314.1 sigma-70 family RNA polymerase sigma factor [Flavobacterium sufflavum]
MNQYTDTQLINKILDGELALYEILIRRNNPFLYKIGRSYNYNHEDTQDLMQDTFIDAYLNLSKFENRSSFKTWIIRIMINNCYKKLQKFSYKNEVSTEINEKAIPMFSDNSQTDTNKIMMNKELNFIVENALTQIPLDYRMVFSLREIAGLNIAETAQSLDISESNVKVRFNRAKAMLRKQIEKSYVATELYEFNLIYCDAMVLKVMNTIKLR